jgi:HAD superfamily hydrolase (TIGR01484 family)
VKIEAIFSDYDGTLSPLQVPREEAFIPTKLLRILEDVSNRIPVAVITTKDLGFVKERVPFADAIAAICGLDLQIGERTFLDKPVRRNIESVNRAFREVLRIAETYKEVIVEGKTTSDGDLIAFCVDWRMSRNPAGARRIVKPFLTRCRGLGLYVVESDLNPFADIFTMKVDKGTAFVKLKRELGLSGPIMYLGDSEFDNPALELADVSIGIRHRGMSPNLLSKYYVEFDELDAFFSSLLVANFNFVPSMVRK